MGCLPSKPFTDAAALQAQVRQLQQALAACQGGGAGYAPPLVLPAGGSKGGFADVLFFPDPGMPCRHGNACRRNNCTYVHGPTSLTKLLQVLGSARASICVCVFTITCDEIADALLQAHRRGVAVRIITDNDQSKTQGSDIDRLRAAGVPLKMDADQAHMHHKFAVIDNRMLVNGSFNWTRQAVLANQENVIVTDNPTLVCAFAAQFEVLWKRYR